MHSNINSSTVYNSQDLEATSRDERIKKMDYLAISKKWNNKICSNMGEPRDYHTSSVQFSLSVLSDSLRPLESQHARPPCPSLTPRVRPDSRPSSQWCHPAISSSVVPSPPAPNPSQHQSLFQWVNSSHEVAKVLEFKFQHQSFQWTPRADLLGWTVWTSLQSKGLSIVFSNTTVQKHQFFGAQLSSQSSFQ